MSGITNFSLIKSINSLLRPLGLAISNPDQMIRKVAFAALVIGCALPIAEAQEACSQTTE